MVEKDLGRIALFVCMFILGVIFGIVLTSCSGYSTDLYLDYGVCYDVSSNLSVCSQDCDPEVIQPHIDNVTYDCPYITNVSCPSYNFTGQNLYLNDTLDKLSDDIYFYHDVFQNITSGFESDVATFNLTQRYADVYANWKSCTGEFSRYYNETQRLRPFESNATECAIGYSFCRNIELPSCLSQVSELENGRWLYALGGAVLSGVAVYQFTRRDVPSFSNLSDRFSRRSPASVLAERDRKLKGESGGK